MEISIENMGVILFGMIVALIINDLYNELKKIKSRLAGKTSMPHYDNPPAPPRKLFTQEFVEQKDKEIKGLGQRIKNQKELLEQRGEEIKELKAELNKVKFDYACEVAGRENSKVCKNCGGKGKVRNPYSTEEALCGDCKGIGEIHPIACEICEEHKKILFEVDAYLVKHDRENDEAVDFMQKIRKHLGHFNFKS